MDIIIRQEQPTDYSESEEVTREAFWNNFVPGCDEHYLLNIMRDDESFVKELDFVAEYDGKIVGNAVCTKAKIICDDFGSYEVLCLGPISVLPDYQGKGIGASLMEELKKAAKRLKYVGILLYGDPDYYSKFGFVPAEELGIRTADNMYADSLQAYQISPGSLLDVKGRFVESSIYEVDKNSAEEFDKKFPRKEKISDTPSQQKFKQIVSKRKKYIPSNH